jgi:hypothetical protein
MSLRDIIPILQIAIGPVILVSGVSLLLLSMTNRFAHVSDRTRQLRHELLDAAEHGGSVAAQMQILLRRAHIIRAAITLSALSILLAAVLIIVLFIFVTLQIGWAGPIIGLFILCMACLIVSIVLFLGDINLSLSALKLEVGPLDEGGEHE